MFLPVTVYVQDVNDHAPEFQNVPYHLEVDELTPVGVTVFRGIQAVDRDKPNTANSDITYSIVGGNENNSFILSDPIEGILVVNKGLDYDNGIREFKIQIQASDHGSPTSLSSVTTMTIRVKDADDQNPVFSQDVYRASVSETAAITVSHVHDQPIISRSSPFRVNHDASVVSLSSCCSSCLSPADPLTHTHTSTRTHTLTERAMLTCVSASDPSHQRPPACGLQCILIPASLAADCSGYLLILSH